MDDPAAVRGDTSRSLAITLIAAIDQTLPGTYLPRFEMNQMRAASANESVSPAAITIRRHIAVGHKFAAQAIEKGEIILKYNCPIGTAISRIAPGEYVHTHNVESNYLPTYELPK